ncbi:hypothetical protein I79_007536 [Cricetulus griseus]|uniref:Uncharacterized protein n=1 Tax=Cricetulus griseus TaxID=10029 RepID=G3HAS8_CRIGR|nr:hypothetical protein I79_007536 [Cricetulus griseus]
MCVHTISILGALEGQKKASNPLKLDLQMFVSLRVGARNQTPVLHKNSECS